MRHRNPWTTSRPSNWSSMTRTERKAWNRKHWTSSPSGVSKKRVRTPSKQKTAPRFRDPEGVMSMLAEAESDAEANRLARHYGFKNANHALADLGEQIEALEGQPRSRRNPRVSFRTCHGKKVRFKAKSRRKGKVPKHLKPYLFKKGHKPRKRCR